MKFFIKLFCLVLSILVIGATLCGCQELDDMRARTAVFDDDTKESFTFRDTSYKKIDTPKNVFFILNNTEGGYHITEKDVPVMLADAFGHHLIFKDTGVAPVVTAALNVFVDTSATSADDLVDSLRNSQYYGEDRFTYYIREDKFENVKELLNSSEVDRYYLSIWEEHYADQLSWNAGFADYNYADKLIDQETTDAINRTLKSGEKTTWYTLEKKGLREWNSFQLFPCDKDIVITNGRIYNIVTDTIEYYIYEEQTDGVLYKAADEDTALLSKLYKMMENTGYTVEDIDWHVRYSDSGWN